MPALAGLAGLSTAQFLMYQMVGVDELHVLDLGVTRMLVHRLVRVFSHACGSKGAVCGSTKSDCRVVNMRIEEIGKRCKASMSAPGCVSRYHFLCFPSVFSVHCRSALARTVSIALHELTALLFCPSGFRQFLSWRSPLSPPLVHRYLVAVLKCSGDRGWGTTVK